VDIPRWPDFFHTWGLTVTKSEGTSTGSSKVKEWGQEASKAGQFAAATLGTSMAVDDKPDKEDSKEDFHLVTLSDMRSPFAPSKKEVIDGEPTILLVTIDDLRNSIKTNDERKHQIERFCAVRFALKIGVRRVDRTLSSKVSSHLKDGKTIEGTWRDHKVLVYCLPEDNDALEEVDRGDVVALSCQLTDWDTFYKRPIFESL